MHNQITQAQDGQNYEPVYPRIYIPDYTDEFKFLNRQIQQFLESDHYQVLNATALRVEKYAKSIPLVLDVKNHHHFEWGSKTLMFLIIGCVLTTFGSIYFAVNSDNEVEKVNARNLALQQQNACNADEAHYFYLVRGHYPEIVKQINKRIAKDSIGYLKAADEKIKLQNLKKGNEYEY